jgi:putative transposase
MAIPQSANQRWSLDFVSDALSSSRKFRILAVVDDFNRECLALVVDNSLSGARVTRELDRIVELRGAPCMIVSDNGTELTSHAMFTWQEERSVEWHYIAPGKGSLSIASSLCSSGVATNCSAPSGPKCN